jgi:3-hydroxybutyryl-CoA dehydrogenase
MEKVSIIGAGAMGSGIAQVAATCGHEVVLYDSLPKALEVAKLKLAKILDRLIEKDRMSIEEACKIKQRIVYSIKLESIENSDLIIEAIVENLEVKKNLFSSMEYLVSEKCILASNTSSLSITSIAAACKIPERVIGIHFFNPAPLMPLVEIIPALQSKNLFLKKGRRLIDSWKKTTVMAKDTPGFIVNRIARPFYGEAIRILEEGLANIATIDWAMKEIGGFPMGPFELMDYIGHDVNYIVTETVFKEFFFDPRYKPSFSQKRLIEAKRLGRKSGHGFYNYTEKKRNPSPLVNQELGTRIVNRVVCLLINEAIDACFLNIASEKDIDLAMTKGVNYPKGLLAWANEKGLTNVLAELEKLFYTYGEDRYRPSPLLKKMENENIEFFS